LELRQLGFNSRRSSFPVENGGNGQSARFIFANLNGTISAWNGGPTAFTQVTTPNAVYTGLAINQAKTQLYAARSGGIDVFNSSLITLLTVRTPRRWGHPYRCAAHPGIAGIE
jgi:hypothetical protein